MSNSGGRAKQWWRQFLGFGTNEPRKAIEVLSDQYIDAKRDAARLRQEARRMQYPQFCNKLAAMAAQRTEHAEMLANKIRLLGGNLPGVPDTPPTEKNSWEYLLAELDERQRDVDELLTQARQLRAEMPDIAALLQRIFEDGKTQRAAIRDMLMKSDPQSYLASVRRTA